MSSEAKRIKLIGCYSTMNEVKASGWEQKMDCTFLNYDYHARTDLLHDKVQEIINASQDFELIILTYGRCSNSLVGLLSPRVSMLIPATHDCINLLLGSRARYLKIFEGQLSTYYFSQGWLDYGRTPHAEYLEYVDKYGEVKAKRLIKMLYGHYNKATFIKTPGIENPESYRQKLKVITDFFGWETEEIEGDSSLLDSLLQGQKGSESIYVQPGQTITLNLLAGGEL